MYGLPHTTEIRKQLPKKAIYAKFDLKPSQRDSFDSDISRIDITAIISPSTIPSIAAGETIKEFYLLTVQLKQKNYNSKNIELLSKLIPQNILIALQYENETQFTIYHTKLISSIWYPTDEYQIKLKGLNLDTVWENIVKNIGNIEVEQGNTLTEQIEGDDKRAKILRQIDTLEKQMRSTTQPRRQRELYAEIKKLKLML